MNYRSITVLKCPWPIDWRVFLHTLSIKVSFIPMNLTFILPECCPNSTASYIISICGHWKCGNFGVWPLICSRHFLICNRHFLARYQSLSRFSFANIPKNYYYTHTIRPTRLGLLIVASTLLFYHFYRDDVGRFPNVAPRVKVVLFVGVVL